MTQTGARDGMLQPFDDDDGGRQQGRQPTKNKAARALCLFRPAAGSQEEGGRLAGSPPARTPCRTKLGGSSWPLAAGIALGRVLPQVPPRLGVHAGVSRRRRRKTQPRATPTPTCSECSSDTVAGSARSWLWSARSSVSAVRPPRPAGSSCTQAGGEWREPRACTGCEAWVELPPQPRMRMCAPVAGAPCRDGLTTAHGRGCEARCAPAPKASGEASNNGIR